MSHIPETMRAVMAPEPGGPEVLRMVEVPVPTAGNDEVLIRVHAAGVNRPDILQRKGLYPPPPGASEILGLEVAGVIVDMGPGCAYEMGLTCVCALVPGGGYAEYVVAAAEMCLDIPSALTMREAAALPETLYTVWTNLFDRGFAADGDTVLVHGGTSGIGTMAIALGRLFGVKVIVTCGSDEKCERARELGAAAAINYKRMDFVEETRRLTSGRGVQVVLDMVGGDYVPRNLACLADEGRHVSIAFQRGAVAEISITDIMRRRLMLTGSTLRARDKDFKWMLTGEIERTVWPFAETGMLKPVIDSVYPFEQVAEAHARMESGEHVGKIVLEIGRQ